MVAWVAPAIAAAGSIAGGLMSGRNKSAEEGSSKLKPWLGAMPGLGEATGLVSRWIDQPLEFFPGQTYAGQTAAEQQAIEQLKAGAGAYPGMLEQTLQPTMGAFQQALGAPEAVMAQNLQDVTQNPALQGAAGAIQSQVMRNLQENILPSLTTSAVGRGALGGTRQAVAEGLAARGTSDVLSENLANLYGQAWSQGLGAETQRLGQALGAQRSAMGMAPGLTNLGLSGYTQPAALLSRAGGLERAEEQRAINEAMQRHQFAQNEPLIRGQTGLGLMQPLGAQFGEKVSETQTRSRPSTFGQIGQLAGLGGALIGGMGGPGAIMGGLGSLFGGGGTPVGTTFADPWGASTGFTQGPMGLGFGGMPAWGSSLPY